MSQKLANTDHDAKVLRFNTDVPVEVQRAKYQATAKYDIKLVRKRLEIEEWMHFELKTLYKCEVIKVFYRIKDNCFHRRAQKFLQAQHK